MRITKETIGRPGVPPVGRPSRGPAGGIIAGPSGGLARRLLVVDRHRTIIVRIDELDMLSSASNYVELKLPGSSHLMRATLSALERCLDPTQFMRVHRCAIVNVAAVVEIDRSECPWQLVLKNGKRQAVAPCRQRQLLAWLAGDAGDSSLSERSRPLPPPRGGGALRLA
jgi:hypothetical protein